MKLNRVKTYYSKNKKKITGNNWIIINKAKINAKK